MGRLIKLEFRKFSFTKNIISIMISNIIILGILYLIFFNKSGDGTTEVATLQNIFSIISPLINITFVIFTGILISKIVIGEFKNRTIFLMFNYPISRKKILVSKLLVIILISFILSLASYIMIFLAFILIGQLFQSTIEPITIQTIISIIQKIVISSFIFPLIGLISLYFGILKNSTQSTIVSSVIIALLLNIIEENFSLSSINLVSLLLSLLGILVASLVIRNIEKKDLIV